MLPLILIFLIFRENISEYTMGNNSLPASSTRMVAVGPFYPNTELLAECTSTDIVIMRACDGFISGVAQATGLSTTTFPKGPIALPIPKDYNEMVVEPRKIVIDYITALPNNRMSEPAAYSVYAALVARYPYKGPHEKDIPLVIK